MKPRLSTYTVWFPLHDLEGIRSLSSELRSLRFQFKIAGNQFGRYVIIETVIPRNTAIIVLAWRQARRQSKVEVTR